MATYRRGNETTRPASFYRRRDGGGNSSFSPSPSPSAPPYRHPIIAPRVVLPPTNAVASSNHGHDHWHREGGKHDDNDDDDEENSRRRFSSSSSSTSTSSSWDAAEVGAQDGVDYLYELGRQSASMNTEVGARKGVVDDVFAGTANARFNLGRGHIQSLTRAHEFPLDSRGA